MDIIDKGILSDLSENCRLTYEELSRKYGITANAIKRRVQKLEESGVIAGYSIIFNPAMVDASFVFGLLLTDGSRDERELVNIIGMNQYIIAAAAYTGGNYALVAEYSTTEELAELSSFLRGVESVQNVELHSYLYPRGKKVKLTKLHLQVLAPLIIDARKSIVEIVKETGISARRVRRALNELIEGDGLKFQALLELGAESGIPFLIKAGYDEKKKSPEEIHEWLQTEYALPFWEVYLSATEPIFYVLMAVDYLTEIEEIVRTMRTSDFILSCSAFIGICHDYFSGPRHRELARLLVEGGFIDKIPRQFPISNQ